MLPLPPLPARSRWPSRPALETLRSLGERVRTLRQDAGLTQRGLAERASIALGTVQTIESGARMARWQSLQQVAAALNETPDALLLRPAVAPPAISDLNEEDLIVARAYNRASTAVRQQVQRLLQGEVRVADDDVARVLLQDVLPAIGPLLERVRALTPQQRARLTEAVLASISAATAAEDQQQLRKRKRR